MKVSISKDKIVCYNVGNAITNAKVRGRAPALKKVRVPSPHLQPLSPNFDAYARRYNTAGIH